MEKNNEEILFLAIIFFLAGIIKYIGINAIIYFFIASILFSLYFLIILYEKIKKKQKKKIERR